MLYSDLSRIQNNQTYMSGMRPVLNKRALFSDMSSEFVCPPDPNPYSIVTIKFRAAKNNIDKVYFVCKNEKHLMMKYKSDDLFDWYEYELELDDEKVSYYFEVSEGKLTCVYDSRGVAKNVEEYYKFVIVPGNHVPRWAKGAVMYQIYVDRFYNGDPSNDVLTDEYNYIGEHVTRVEDWNKYPATMGVREFYGGDLQGVLDKMDYLQDLGIDVIYFNPLFVSPSNHKYDIQDYDYIDPHFGKIVNDTGNLLEPWQKENKDATRYINRIANKENLEASNELFAKVVEEAHKRGMKVILDGVFNHCGSFNKWLDRERIYENFEGYEKGAYISADSPYRDYFHFYEQNRWPYNPTYDGWWGHDTLPKLNYEGSRQLYDYILYIGKKWVSPPYNADGWRLDVAADLGHSPEFNHQFWKDFHKAVREANPEAIVLAEHYGSPREWIENGEWDTVMNYDAFMEPITWFLTGMQKHSDDYREDLYGNADSFWGAMHYHGAAFSGDSFHIAMNELSNHDHSRFLTRTNKRVGRVNTMGPEAANEGVNKAVMREAVTIQMTWAGAPTIYYGDEAGVCGFTDPDNRRTYPWGNEDHDLIEFHKAMIRIHKESDAFKFGSLKYLLGDYNLLGFVRFYDRDHYITLVNNNDYELEREYSVWESGIPRECEMERIIQTDESGFTTDVVKCPVVGGKLRILLPKKSAVVLRYRQ
ncbi:MAG: glycoside hydrolase family 13 protein [Lachnospiraceae bacterium]|nr:glycoside hydrolase family 13 protein [Lachnospiraceae bacterium]